MGGVSNPTNFTHRVHVGFDPTTGVFVGLPKEWEKLLTASAITKDDYAKNPKAVLEVLEFYTEKLVKREDEPNPFSSLTPQPAAETAQNKQLGYPSGGNSIAPPRPGPPSGYQRKESYSMHTSETASSSSQQYSPANDKNASMAYRQNAPADPRMEEERRRRDEAARRQREREYHQREQERRDQEELAAYNASLPKGRAPLAQQELGGYGGEAREESPQPGQNRYNPTRPPPSAPGASRDRQQPAASLRQPSSQRAVTPTSNSQPYVNAGAKAPLTSQAPNGQRQPSPSQGQMQSHGPGGQSQAATRMPPAGTNGQAHSRGPAAAAPAQPKPLNVAAKQATPPPVNDAVKKAEQALTKKDDTRKEARMSSMTESEVMAKLREVVSKDRPLESYNKQKKIGQGASGSVYVARIRENAPSPTARMLLREHGPRAQVAIKQMDLRSQPRKELIVNEIIVMKDSKHPNIVNFLDAFLQEDQSELWVVMEFMEGGALTDVIDNNPSISEDQIATICLEVCGQGVWCWI